MAASPEAMSRARLLQKMNRELGQTDRSVASSTGSFHGNHVSDMSWHSSEVERSDSISLRLPNLRDSAKKLIRREQSPVSESEYELDTEALKNVFPDFSQGGHSDDSSLSIEMSRGPIRLVSGVDKQSRQPDQEGESGTDNSNHSGNPQVGKYEVAKSPPLKSRFTSREGAQSPKQQQTQNVTESRNPFEFKSKVELASAAAAKKDMRGPNGRDLKNMQARVRDEEDDSVMSLGRPAECTNEVAKPTRFSNSNQPNVGPEQRGPQHGPRGNGRVTYHTDKWGNIGRPGSKGTNTVSLHADAQGKVGPPYQLKVNNGLMSERFNADLLDTPTKCGPPRPRVPKSATQQSVVLPDLPNLSELVSGVYQDGTPVFSKQQKGSTRFTGYGAPRADNEHHSAGDAEDDFLPMDEQAILVSLRILQDRVVELEAEKAASQKQIEELKSSNANLKATSEFRHGRPAHRRADSAVALNDDSSDAENNSKRKALENTVKSLQGRLEAASRKNSILEINVKNITQDRDSAVTQLGVAYVAQEDVKNDNQALRSENEQLCAQLELLDKQTRQDAKNSVKIEASLRKKLERRDETVKEVREMMQEIWKVRQPAKSEKPEAPSVQDGSYHDGHLDFPIASKKSQDSAERQADRPHPLEPQAPSVQDVPYHAEHLDSAVPSKEPHSLTEHQADRPQQMGEPQAPSVQSRLTNNNLYNLSNPSRKRNDLEEDQHANAGPYAGVAQTESHDPENGRSLQYTGRPHPFEGDEESDMGDSTVTTLPDSFVDGTEIVRLRQVLEEERAAFQARNANAANVQGTTNPEHAQYTETQPLDNRYEPSYQSDEDSQADNAPRDDDLTGRFSIEVTGNAGQGAYPSAPTAPVAVNALSPKKYDVSNESKKENQDNVESQNSAQPSTLAPARDSHNKSATSAPASDFRNKSATGEMTSGVILPDITMQGIPKSSDDPHLSGMSKQVVQNLVSHDREKCSVCKRFGVQKHEGERSKLTIPRPVRASTRYAELSEVDEDVTIRPSQPPARALATVMKGLEDEMAHLKIKLSEFEGLYKSHDASISRDVRKRLAKKVRQLLKAVDVKADQIYSLYDVLEGQKADGHEVTEEEFDLTLSSLGVTDDINTEATFFVTKSTSGEANGKADDSSDDGLSWDGIEATARTAKSDRRDSAPRSRSTLVF